MAIVRIPPMKSKLFGLVSLRVKIFFKLWQIEKEMMSSSKIVGLFFKSWDEYKQKLWTMVANTVIDRNAMMIHLRTRKYKL